MTAFEIGGVRVQVSGSGALHTTPINLTVKEVDGSPSVAGVTVVKFPNGTLTDNGGGSVTYTAAGGGGTPTALSGAGGDVETVGVGGIWMHAASGQDIEITAGDCDMNLAHGGAFSLSSSQWFMNGPPGSTVGINASGDVVLEPASGTGKLAAFGAAGAVQGVAASITDFASLKTWMQAVGFIGA